MIGPLIVIAAIYYYFQTRKIPTAAQTYTRPIDDPIEGLVPVSAPDPASRTPKAYTTLGLNGDAKGVSPVADTDPLVYEDHIKHLNIQSRFING